MDPQIVVAIINASAKAGSSLFERFWPGSKRESNDFEKAIGTLYEKLRPELTSNSVRILVAVENGENPTRRELRRQAFPDLTFKARDHEDRFDSEFHYRLKTMCVLGLLLEVAGGREYAITDLGFAFVSKARKNGHYPDVFKSKAG